MTQKRKYSFIKRKRPSTPIEVMAQRFSHAKASLEIEGLKLSIEEITVFEECIKRGCSIEERTSLLKERFPNYDYAIRA